MSYSDQKNGQSLRVFSSDVFIGGSLTVGGSTVGGGGGGGGGGGTAPLRMAIDVTWTGDEGDTDENGVEVYTSAQEAVNSLQSRRVRTVDQETCVQSPTEIALRNLGSEKCCMYMNGLQNIKFVDEQANESLAKHIYFSSGFLNPSIGLDVTIGRGDSDDKLLLTSSNDPEFATSTFQFPQQGQVFVRSSDARVSKVVNLQQWAAIDNTSVELTLSEAVARAPVPVATITAVVSDFAVLKYTLTTTAPHGIAVDGELVEIFIRDTTAVPSVNDQIHLVRAVSATELEWFREDFFVGSNQTEPAGNIYFNWFPGERTRDGAAIEYLGTTVENLWCLSVTATSCTDITFSGVSLASLNASFSSIALNNVSIGEHLETRACSITHNGNVTLGHLTADVEADAHRAALQLQNTTWEMSNDQGLSVFLVNFWNTSVISSNSTLSFLRGDQGFFITCSALDARMPADIEGITVLEQSPIDIGTDLVFVVGHIGPTRASQSFFARGSQNSGTGSMILYFATRDAAVSYPRPPKLTSIALENANFMVQVLNNYVFNNRDNLIWANLTSRSTLVAASLSDAYTLASVALRCESNSYINMEGFNIFLALSPATQSYAMVTNEFSTVRASRCIFDSQGGFLYRFAHISCADSTMFFYLCEMVDFGVGNTSKVAGEIATSDVFLYGCQFIYSGFSFQQPSTTLLALERSRLVVKPVVVSENNFTISQFANYRNAVIQASRDSTVDFSGTRFEGNAEFPPTQHVVGDQNVNIGIHSSDNVYDRVEFSNADVGVQVSNCSTLSLTGGPGSIFYRNVPTPFVSTGASTVCVADPDAIIEDITIPVTMNFSVDTDSRPWVLLTITRTNNSYAFTADSVVRVDAGDRVLTIVESWSPSTLVVAVTAIQPVTGVAVLITGASIVGSEITTLSSTNTIAFIPVNSGALFPSPFNPALLPDITAPAGNQYFLLSEQARSSFLVVNRTISAMIRMSFVFPSNASADVDLYPAQLPIPNNVSIDSPTNPGTFDQVILTPYSNNTGPSGELISWQWADFPVGAASPTGSTETTNRIIWVYAASGSYAMVKIESS